MDVTETSTAIIAQVEANPTLVLVDDKKFEDFYEKVRAEAKAMPVDLTTDKGRKAIASMAHKIARTKTAIDDAGKKLNEDARKQIGVVDESRRKIRDRFDTLKDEVRKPLTDWEDAEDARVERVNTQRRHLENIHRDLDGKTSSDIRSLYVGVAALKLTDELFGADAKTLEDVKKSALDRLEYAFGTRAKEESDAAELTRLRAENEAREAAEAERRAEEEKEAHRRDYARRMINHIKQCGLGMIDGQTYPYAILFHELEEKVVIDESFGELEGEAQQARIDALAALNAGMEADRKAEQERVEREARERADAEAQQRVEAAERQAREAEAAAARQIEEARLQRERETAEQERVEREQREADARRLADREHRATIMGAAKAAIIEIGIDEAKAKEIVLAIAAGNVPHVSIKF